MEKLILRSVLYGADKIPDHWFEKVPGGFYKSKDPNKNGSNNSNNTKSKSSSGGTGDRNSNRDNDTRDYKERRSYDDSGYRSEGGRRSDRRNRSSYDGGADSDHRRRDDRRRPQEERSHRRRHSLDDDRYGHDDGHRSPRDRHPDDRQERGRRDPSDRLRDEGRPSTGGSDRPSNKYITPAALAGGGAATAAPAAAPPYPSSNPQSPTFSKHPFPQEPQARPASSSNGYVPYAHIYGTPPPPPQQQFPPPPPINTTAPNNGPRMMSPTGYASPQGYQQNPFAQQAPTAAAAGAGSQYTGQPGFMNPRDPRFNNGGSDPRYSARRFNGYDDNGRTYSNSPPPSRQASKQEYSPPYDSYDGRSDERRSRGDRRDGNDSYSQQHRDSYVDPRQPLRTQVPTMQPSPPLAPPPARNDGRHSNDYGRDGPDRGDSGRGEDAGHHLD